MERLNTINTGLVPGGSSYNPAAAALPDGLGPLSGLRLLGAALGKLQGVHADCTPRITDYATAALNGAAAGGLTVAVEADVGTYYRITGDGGGANRGWRAVSSRVIAAPAAVDLFSLPASNKPIWSAFRWRFSHLDASILFGLMDSSEAAPSPLTAGSILGVVNGLGFWKDGNASATALRGYVCKTGPARTDLAMDNIVLAVNTWYESGFRVLDNRGGVEFYHKLATGQWGPSPGTFTGAAMPLTNLPAAGQTLGLVLAMMGTSANARTFDFTPPLVLQDLGDYGT